MTTTSAPHPHGRQKSNGAHIHKPGESTPAAALVGPWQQGEFAAVAEELTGGAPWPQFQTLLEARRFMDVSSKPLELVFLAAPRPGFLNQQHAHQLQQAAPLVRLVVVAGAWCEGEWRTGKPLPGTWRLYWYELIPWWNTALRSMAIGRIPPWSMPVPAGNHGPVFDEAGLPPADGCRRLAVAANDYSVYQTIKAALAPHGWSAVWHPQDRLDGRGDSPDQAPPSAAVWDGGQLDEPERLSLERFCRRMHPEAGVVVLLDFPRAEHSAQVRLAGASAILPKPYRVAAFAETLASIARKP